jgi:hypothetical protein
MVKIVKSFQYLPRQVEVVLKIGVVWRGLWSEKTSEHKKAKMSFGKIKYHLER